MEFELIHFPEFQYSFFGKEYCSSILETYIAVRKKTFLQAYYAYYA